MNVSHVEAWQLFDPALAHLSLTSKCCDIIPATRVISSIVHRLMSVILDAYAETTRPDPP